MTSSIVTTAAHSPFVDDREMNRLATISSDFGVFTSTPAAGVRFHNVVALGPLKKTKKIS